MAKELTKTEDPSKVMGISEVQDALVRLRGSCERQNDIMVELVSGQAHIATSYNTFEDFMNAEFPRVFGEAKYTREHYYYLASVARVTVELRELTGQSDLRIVGSHAAELAKLKDPALRLKAYKQAQETAALTTYKGKKSTENGKVTAEHVKRTVAGLMPIAETRSRATSSPSAESNKEQASNAPRDSPLLHPGVQGATYDTGDDDIATTGPETTSTSQPSTGSLEMDAVTADSPQNEELKPRSVANASANVLEAGDESPDTDEDWGLSDDASDSSPSVPDPASKLARAMELLQQFQTSYLSGVSDNILQAFYEVNAFLKESDEG